MGDSKNSSNSSFYMNFNLMSAWLVPLLPFILLSIYFTFDMRSDICDSLNGFLMFFIIFALVILNRKQASEVIYENDDEKSHE